MTGSVWLVDVHFLSALNTTTTIASTTAATTVMGDFSGESGCWLIRYMSHLSTSDPLLISFIFSRYFFAPFNHLSPSVMTRVTLNKLWMKILNLHGNACFI